MSTLTKICFDASIHEDHVGIGIYNFDTKEEIIHRFKVKDMDPQTAETMALIKTLHYMRENDIDKAHLFTDNIGVANKGISENLTEDLTTTLTWIPREFNVDADRLSKRAHLLKGKELGVSGRCNKGRGKIRKAQRIQKNLEMYDPEIIAEKQAIRELKRNTPQIKNLRNAVKKYPLESRINLLSKFSTSKLTNKILESLTEDDIKVNHNNYRKSDRVFLKTYFSLIKDNECNIKPFMNEIKRQYIRKQHTENSLNSILCDLENKNRSGSTI